VTAPAPTIVDLLRHGACEGGNIFRGVTDSALSEAGWRQMADALSSGIGWQRVISSPLQRCRRFAEWFASDRGLPLAVEPALREIHFGHWEGRDITAVWQENKAFLERYYRSPGNLAPPGGETPTEALARLRRAWDDLLTCHQGEHLLLICHGGAIRLLLCHLLGAPLASAHFFDVPHGCLTRLRIYHLQDGDVVQLVFHQPPPLQADAQPAALPQADPCAHGPQHS